MTRTRASAQVERLGAFACHSSVPGLRRELPGARLRASKIFAENVKRA